MAETDEGPGPGLGAKAKAITETEAVTVTETETKVEKGNWETGVKAETEALTIILAGIFHKDFITFSSRFISF